MNETFTMRRYQRALKRIDRRTTRIKGRLEALQAKKDAKGLSPAKYQRKKTALDTRLRTLSARERTLRGALAQERARRSGARATVAR